MLKKSSQELFWEKVQKTESCWLWTGTRSNGYGSGTANKKHFLAHRRAYEYIIGSIPDGLTIDHLCKTRLCVNPNHMEVVTLSENVKRARPWLKSSVASGLVQKAKTQCPLGHPYDKINTYVTPIGKRDCKECRRAACRRNYHRNKSDN